MCELVILFFSAARSGIRRGVQKKKETNAPAQTKKCMPVFKIFYILPCTWYSCVRVMPRDGGATMHRALILLVLVSGLVVFTHFTSSPLIIVVWSLPCNLVSERFFYVSLGILLKATAPALVPCSMHPRELSPVKTANLKLICTLCWINGI